MENNKKTISELPEGTRFMLNGKVYLKNTGKFTVTNPEGKDATDVHYIGMRDNDNEVCALLQMYSGVYPEKYKLPLDIDTKWDSYKAKEWDYEQTNDVMSSIPIGDCFLFEGVKYIRVNSMRNTGVNGEPLIAVTPVEFRDSENLSITPEDYLVYEDYRTRTDYTLEKDVIYVE
jgi:hypothetical protein